MPTKNEPAPSRWGVWNRTHGAWCAVYMPGMYARRPPSQRCWGTKTQAKYTAEQLQKDFPQYDYEVCPFDADREPDGADEGLINLVQFRMLEAYEDGGNPYNETISNHKKKAIETLFNRKLIMRDDTRRSRCRVTRAGKRVLEKMRALARKGMN